MTDHDFNGNESVIPSDIEYTLSRIGTIADSVDSSMTVGEIVRRAYLCGVGDTLDECIGLASRILVMKDGLLRSEFDCPVDHKPDQTPDQRAVDAYEL